MSCLIVLNSSPYATSNSKDALDIVLTLAAFEQQPGLLIRDQAVRLLMLDIQQQNELKHPGKMLRALPIYDVKKLYIDAQALKQYRVSEKYLQYSSMRDGRQGGLQYELLNHTGIASLYQKYQHIMVF